MDRRCLFLQIRISQLLEGSVRHPLEEVVQGGVIFQLEEIRRGGRSVNTVYFDLAGILLLINIHGKKDKYTIK